MHMWVMQATLKVMNSSRLHVSYLGYDKSSALGGKHNYNHKQLPQEQIVMGTVAKSHKPKEAK